MISNTNRRSDEFTQAAPGTATDFTFTKLGVYVPVKDETHIKVYKDTLLDTATDYQLLTISTDYTVTFAGADNTNATVKFVTAPATGDKVLFLRSVPYSQTTDLTNNSLLEAESLERQLDLLAMQTQQLEEKIEYAFTIGETIPDGPSSLDKTVAQRANKFLSFDASGELAISTTNTENITSLMLEGKDWAQKTNGVVNTYTSGVENSDGTDYSTKAYAIGGTGITDTSGKGAAKEWAINPENDLVDTSGYSALHHAAKASADRVLTNADVVSTGNDVTSTNADVLLTNADVVLTNADVLLTNADVVTTGNKVTYSAEWANKAHNSLISSAAGGDTVDDYSALHHATNAATSATYAEDISIAMAIALG
jgi:hypothetical protein